MILLAGGTGRLGTLIVEKLTSRDLDVRVLTRDRRNASHLASRAEVATGDVRDPGSITAAMAGVDLVISAVHGFTGPRGVSPATVDRDGNANLTDAAKAHGAGLVLMSVVGAAPDSPIGLFRMKYAAERYAAASGVPTTVVRAAAFAELWIEILRQTAARSGRPLVFGRGDNPINFVSVTDVASLVERVVIDPAARGGVLEIGGPVNITFNQLAQAVQAADGRDGAPRHVPPLMLRVMAGTVGHARPELGRQIRAALTMDHADFSVDPAPIHQRWPGLARTRVSEVLASHAA